MARQQKGKICMWDAFGQFQCGKTLQQAFQSELTRDRRVEAAKGGKPPKVEAFQTQQQVGGMPTWAPVGGGGVREGFCGCSGAGASQHGGAAAQTQQQQVEGFCACAATV